MASPPHKPMKPAPRFLMVLTCLPFALWFSAIPTDALKIDVQLFPDVKLEKECSKTCVSDGCGVAPLLRYGKYCGLMYSGCPGEVPCDSLDACCMDHDKCIQSKNNDYISLECNRNFLNCVDKFDKSKERQTFKGNTCSVDEVVNVMRYVSKVAIFAGKIFHHKKQDGV